MRHFLLLLSLLIATSSWARPPEEVVAEYVAATQQEGPTSVARFIHPDELARFRAGVEPTIVAALGSPRSQDAFASFADSGNPRALRTFANDAEFLSTFIAWISRQNTDASMLMKGATITPLGHVKEGEICHVVLRIRVDSKAPETDRITHISTKPYQGEPMLMLTPDLERMMVPFNRGRQPGSLP